MATRRSYRSQRELTIPITDEAYQWDQRGNLTKRTDGATLFGSPDLQEDFQYDAYDRLVTTTVTSPNVPGSPKTYNNEYYDSGRIKRKGAGQGPDYLNYVYGTGNGAGQTADAGPHAVQAVTIGSGTRTFVYDDNGNVVSDNTGRTFIWSAFNKPLQAANATYQSAWAYGPDRNYYLQTNQTYVGAVGCNDPFWYTTRTYYAGDAFERVENWGNQGNVEYRMYIQVGGARIALHTEWSTGAPPREEYLHQDHLGSLVAITGSDQSLVDRLSYDPWGKRRGAGFGGVGNAWLSMSAGAYFTPTSLSHTRRGFTGHEQVDQLNFIHMNGRIYDPEIGRFLSADPMVQFPESTQGLDRYTYVNNNPLSYTDPTGHGIWSTVATLLSFIPGVNVIAAVALVAVGGYLDSGSLTGALFAVAGAVAAFGVAGLNLENQLQAALANGLVQGGLGAAQGQKFGAAFLSAAVSSGFGPRAGTKSDLFGDPVGRVIQSAVVGGTASVIGGGKFANGAATGAFVAAGREWRDGLSTGNDGRYSPRYDPNRKAGILLSPELEKANIDAAMKWAKENELIPDDVEYEYRYEHGDLWSKTAKAYALGTIDGKKLIFGRGSGSPYGRLSEELGATSGFETALNVAAHEFKHTTVENYALPPPKNWADPVDPVPNRELNARGYGDLAVLKYREKW